MLLKCFVPESAAFFTPHMAISTEQLSTEHVLAPLPQKTCSVRFASCPRGTYDLLEERHQKQVEEAGIIK